MTNWLTKFEDERKMKNLLDTFSSIMKDILMKKFLPIKISITFPMEWDDGVKGTSIMSYGINNQGSIGWKEINNQETTNSDKDA